jgi:hypothetical protein
MDNKRSKLSDKPELPTKLKLENTRIWKTECATLMISQKGCISEKLLRARDRGEFISYFICDGSRR